jgi:hypothetical protein
MDKLTLIWWKNKDGVIRTSVTTYIATIEELHELLKHRNVTYDQIVTMQTIHADQEGKFPIIYNISLNQVPHKH